MRSPIVRAALCTLAALVLLAPRPRPRSSSTPSPRPPPATPTPTPSCRRCTARRCSTRTSQATIASDGTAYVKTGDIPAEWLRDASAQVRPYLFFAKSDPQVAQLLRGMIARMGKYLQIDPYANAFTLDYRVWEQKFELDSLAYPITLAWTYWKQTGDASIFTGDLSLGFDKALDTMEREQDHPRNSKYTHREMPQGGKGNPVATPG